MDLLKQIPLFQELNNRQLNAIGQQTYQKAYDPEEIIVEQGKMGREFFIIINGTVRIEKNRKLISTVSRDGYFGEIALIDGGVRGATVISNTDVQVLCVAREAFRHLLKEVHGLNDQILLSLCKHFRHIERELEVLRKKNKG